MRTCPPERGTRQPIPPIDDPPRPRVAPPRPLQQALPLTRPLAQTEKFAVDHPRYPLKKFFNQPNAPRPIELATVAAAYPATIIDFVPIPRASPSAAPAIPSSER